jgi:PTH1 family peptidyl-tRNA hydrolase
MVNIRKKLRKFLKKRSDNMKLIVGLGNPGNEYENTRHNIGFIFIDALAKNLNVSIDKKKFNGLYTETFINGEKVILLKPQSYMNLSGEVVIQYLKYFKIKVEDMLVINDDLDMEFGKLRLRQDGSSGGHNGLKNIALHINTEKFKRLKVGISNNKDIDTKDYVLGHFSKEDLELLESKKEEVVNLLKDFIVLDFDRLMNKYNKK